MSKYAHKQWKLMLHLLAERDAPVELSRRTDGDDASPFIGRSRLFEVQQDGCIVVERPPLIPGGPNASVDDDIELTLMHNSERYVATCTVKAVIQHRVNDKLKVTCFRLSPGRRPMREQRRSFFRVNLAASDLDPAVLTSGGGDNELSFKARVVNLSGGGIGVCVRDSRSVLNQIKRTRYLNCKTRLSRHQTIEAPVRIAHIEAVGEDGLYLGLEFDVEDAGEAQALQDQMHQCSADYQREQLKRRRA